MVCFQRVTAISNVSGVSIRKLGFMYRVEIASVVCFQWVTAISTHFGVSSRNLGFLSASWGVFVVRGGGHSHFPAAG